MKNRVLGVAVFVVTLQLADLAVAAIEIENDVNFGVGALSLDTDTGLAWLDPPLTANLSFNEVSSLLVSDSRYLGFRYATRAELGTFFGNLGLPAGNFPQLSFVLDSGASFLDAAAFVGITPTPANAYTTRGLTADIFNSEQHYYGSILIGDDGRFTLTAAVNALFDGAQNGGIGSWLVRETPTSGEVPEPTSLVVWLLLGVVGAGVALRRRRVSLA